MRIMRNPWRGDIKCCTTRVGHHGVVAVTTGSIGAESVTTGERLVTLTLPWLGSGQRGIKTPSPVRPTRQHRQDTFNSQHKMEETFTYLLIRMRSRRWRN